VVLDRLAASSISYPMRFAHLLMRHPPTAQLLQDLGLATHRHPASPFPIYAHPKRAAGGERQIKQLDAKLDSSFKISNDQAVVRFRTGHAPSYVVNPNNARNKSKSPVHDKKFSFVNPFSSTSR
jgi:hypothetical protein